MKPEQLLALAIAGAVAPWIVEVFKVYLNAVSDKVKTTVSIVTSFVIAFVVLLVSKVDFADPAALVQATLTVFGVATLVYNYLKDQVKGPVAGLLRGVRRP